jgi:hypothetical protein
MCYKCCGKCCTPHSTIKVKSNRFCKNCSGMFDSNDCYDGHLRSGVCNTAFICEICRGWVSSPDVVHVCLGDKCIYCRKSVNLNHLCYITRLDKPLTHSKEWRYIFYDFESTQDEMDPETGLNIHKVNCAVAMVVCPYVHLEGLAIIVNRSMYSKAPKHVMIFVNGQWILFGGNTIHHL